VFVARIKMRTVRVSRMRQFIDHEIRIENFCQKYAIAMYEKSERAKMKKMYYEYIPFYY